MNSYKVLLIPIMINVISQIIKFFISGITDNKFCWKRLFDGSGGMPSSHTALVSSLVTIIGLTNGLDSPMFAICLIFSFVVIYDAMHVRYEAGKHATILNKINKDNKLKEDIGHTVSQVLVGLVLGIVGTIILNILM